MNPLLQKLDRAAEAAMRDIIGGAVRTQAVYAVAKLGIPDLLAGGPVRADELARRAGAHAETLRRVMRYLASRGVFAEDESGRFALTAAGEYLQSGHPRSLRPSAIRAGEGLWRVAGGLLDAVRTGATPHGEPFFQSMDGKEAAFAARMSASTAGLADALAAHPWLDDAQRLLDAGGGNGWLLTQILDRRPSLRGILLDTEATIAAARPVVEQSPAAARCELIAGDFFTAVPPADVVLLSWILHDWPDDRARRILAACRAAGAKKLLIVEVLLPERAEPLAAPPAEVIADPFTLDLQMLLLTGGKERTLNEYRELLGSDGYEVEGAVPLESARGASLLSAAQVSLDPQSPARYSA